MKKRILKIFIFSIAVFLILVMFAGFYYLKNKQEVFKTLLPKIEIKKEKEPELNVIIIWSKARNKEKEILEDISKHLNIIEVYEIKWKPEYAINNFLRLYDFGMYSALYKEEEDGTDKFLLITAIDKKPVYETTRVTAGIEYVNINMLSLKKKYRALTEGRFKVHATDNIPDANHDLVVLLGINYKDYMNTHKSDWNGKIKYLERDLTGYNGWNSLDELFYTLNSIINYAVINRDDTTIDILSDDFAQIHYLLSENPTISNPNLSYKIRVGKKDVTINIVKFKQNKKCTKMAKKVLDKKEIDDGVFVLKRKNRFFKTCAE